MTFMYLHIRADGDGKVVAEVRTTGELRTLGSSNTRIGVGTTLPIMVARIDEFVGLENIDTDDLFAELFSRLSTKEMMDRIRFQLSDGEVLELLRQRLDR